jgi:hypothetical protein
VFPIRSICLALLLLLIGQSGQASAEPLYPDLRALPPKELSPQTEMIDGVQHHVLRFSAEITNVGTGPLELRGDSSTGRTLVFQRIHDDAGGVTEIPVGAFIFHPAHDHWHFEDFASYELWTRADYDAWLASGRKTGRPRWRGTKTTGGQLEDQSFCLRDSFPNAALGRDPAPQRYLDCGPDVQGMSAGWVDGYPYFLPEQWIDLGPDGLTDGDYVLRVEADPLNRLRESPDGADAARESPAANEGVTAFHVEGGCPDEKLLAPPSQPNCGTNEPLGATLE